MKIKLLEIGLIMFSSFKNTASPCIIQGFKFLKVFRRKFFIGKLFQVGLSGIYPGGIPKGCNSKNGLPHPSFNHAV